MELILWGRLLVSAHTSVDTITTANLNTRFEWASQKKIHRGGGTGTSPNVWACLPMPRGVRQSPLCSDLRVSLPRQEPPHRYLPPAASRHHPETYCCLQTPPGTRLGLPGWSSGCALWGAGAHSSTVLALLEGAGKHQGITRSPQAALLTSTALQGNSGHDPIQSTWARLGSAPATWQAHMLLLEILCGKKLA